MITFPSLVYSILGKSTSFGGFNLRRGDNDNKMIWQGVKGDGPNTFVKDLQIELNRVGTYRAKIDGDFGGKTELALKLFQWNAKNISYRLKGDSITKVTCTFHDTVSGQATFFTRRELGIWKAFQYKATGDLVRLKESNYSNIELNSTFKLIDNQYVQKGEFVVSSELFEYIKIMDSEAKNLGLKLVINQSLRQVGVPPSGAVVTPATRSQHFIGHALDLNMVDGSNWNNSAAFKSNRATQSALSFIEKMKSKGLRWGGNFSRMDSPHFDKQILASTFDYEAKYFFNQSSISRKHHISLVE